jgi:predicted Mrr-cat superfamily restriction endonuclease
MVAEDLGQYQFMPKNSQIGGFSHTYTFKWLGSASRNASSEPTRNSLRLNPHFIRYATTEPKA